MFKKKKKEKLILVTLLELLFNNKLIIISYYSVTWPEMSLSHNYSLTVETLGYTHKNK